jgi:NAD(P)-dependent dehydrogenase (short-subunit alcohol dehydrogenase family)
MANVVITGAGMGLGMELLKCHLSRGDVILGCDMEISPELKKLSEEYPKHVYPILMDVALGESVKTGAVKIKETIDHMDYIYQNAGVFYFDDEQPLEKADFERALDQYNINAVGMMRVIQALHDLFVKGTFMCVTASDSASIKWTLDTVYKLGDRHKSIIYNMSKAAMTMGACYFYDELVNRIGGRMLIVHPGWMRTRNGGPNAPNDPAESARHIFAMSTGEKKVDGLFVDYLGNSIPW